MATQTLQFKVSGMMCSFCTMTIEKALKRDPGVRSVLLNLVHGLVLVEADPARTSRDQVAREIEALGYSVLDSTVKQFEADAALHRAIGRRGALALALAMLGLLVDPLNLVGLPARWRAIGSGLLALVVLAVVGQPILRKSWLAARARVVNANVLLSASAWGAFLIGTLALTDPAWPNFYPVATWLMALHLVFGYFKLDTRKRAAEAVRKLLTLQPPTATRVRGEETRTVPLAEVRIGDTLLVRPGERVPLDGEVVEGEASLDESSFTGEAVPAVKAPGASVIGGTLDLDGRLVIRVTRVGEATFLGQIVRLLQQIEGRKPAIELLADRLMNYYGPVVFTVAGLAGVGWLLATGSGPQALLVLITTLIMGYPCALGVTTPMLAAIAGGRGVAIGLLVKASEVFQKLASVDTVAFDKTGTLTFGRPTVTAALPAPGVEAARLLEAAASAERASTHPLGQAIVIYAERERAKPRPVERFQALTGFGVAAWLDGEPVLVGRDRLLADRGVPIDEALRREADARRSAGETVVFVARGGRCLGLVALADTPRPDAAATIATLRREGVRTVMLTGDHARVAAAVATALGLDETHAELLPAEKVAAIERLQADGRRVAMVGDGVNDAPALAQADVGVALGAGTDVAIESAGVVLVRDRLDTVVAALRIGRAGYRRMVENVAIAVLFNVVGLGVAAAGLVTPLLAIGWMIVSIATILVNTLRVQRVPLRPAAPAAAVPAPA
jgi:Cu+-exporting ATPase